MCTQMYKSNIYDSEPVGKYSLDKFSFPGRGVWSTNLIEFSSSYILGSILLTPPKDLFIPLHKFLKKLIKTISPLSSTRDNKSIIKLKLILNNINSIDILFKKIEKKND